MTNRSLCPALFSPHRAGLVDRLAPPSGPKINLHAESEGKMRKTDVKKRFSNRIIVPSKWSSGADSVTEVNLLFFFPSCL